jgi:hypothetical protein
MTTTNYNSGIQLSQKMEDTATYFSFPWLKQFPSIWWRRDEGGTWLGTISFKKIQVPGEGKEKWEIHFKYCSIIGAEVEYFADSK